MRNSRFEKKSSPNSLKQGNHRWELGYILEVFALLCPEALVPEPQGALKKAKNQRDHGG